ncbi:MAG TPA: hypothetical protein VG267_06575 [Terracidiphilus sp.]|jgi:hypothetical protein|nr:hypothetical protein [Terracidiphilus sp.]
MANSQGPGGLLSARVWRTMTVLGGRWLFMIGFSIRRVFGRFAALLVRFLVAVLMAVRFGFSCISMQLTASMAQSATD